MKFDISKTLILAVVIIGAGCGNLTEPSGFSFATLTNVPTNTSVQSNVVTIEGNQFAATAAFVNVSSAVYSTVSINGGSFKGLPNGAANSTVQLSPGNTLQLQQTTSSIPNATRTTTITVGGFTTTFTTVTSSTGGTVTATDANGNTVTVSNILATLTAGTNGVTYTITADTIFSTTNTSGVSGSTIPVTFTLQAISNSGQVIYSTTPSNVAIDFGEEATFPLVSAGALPTTVTGSLPNAVNGYTITTTNYWSSLVSYWRIEPGSLQLQQ